MTLCSVVAVYRVADRLQPVASAASEGSAGLAGPIDERNNIEVYKAVAPGVVFITSTSEGHDMFDSGERQGAGSGLVIDDQGQILTNDHVVAGAERLMVSLGGDKRYPARVVGRDPDTDLAVLQIEAPRDQLKVVPLGDSDTLEIGQKVLAIGNPFGLDRTLTSGIISGLQRPIRAQWPFDLRRDSD
jgi:S1-C subfamily serine protease